MWSGLVPAIQVLRLLWVSARAPARQPSFVGKSVFPKPPQCAIRGPTFINEYALDDTGIRYMSQVLFLCQGITVHGNSGTYS